MVQLFPSVHALQKAVLGKFMAKLHSLFTKGYVDVFLKESVKHKKDQ